MSTQYLGPLLEHGIEICDTAYEYLIKSMTCKDNEMFLRDAVVLITVYIPQD